MKTALLALPAFYLLLATSGLFAQQPLRQTAAENLELELANKKTGIPAKPVDEKLPSSAAEAVQTVPEGQPSPNLRSSEEEKNAASPDRNRRIPEPPADESSGQKISPPPPLDLPAPQVAKKTALTDAQQNEREAQQHKQNAIRRIPPPPKDESNSNQH